jgi:hypothetical protein
MGVSSSGGRVGEGGGVQVGSKPPSGVGHGVPRPGRQFLSSGEHGVAAGRGVSMTIEVSIVGRQSGGSVARRGCEGGGDRVPT